ncbi:hypothetical protein ACIGB6_10090 [Paeniglutamicibacter gangotriensis]|uniref:hypothetical protein n=1 Tax=Paeniglutamicibacter gangotriensis TaxID=254787 RepID=UPI0037C67340
MTCTTPDCEADSILFLCAGCINDLQQYIDKVAIVLPELDVSIARLDNVRVGNAEGGNGSKSAGSAAPLNLDAMQLKINLAGITQDAEYYAKDQFAAGIAWTIADWYTKAELIVSGPADDKPSAMKLAQAAAEVREIVPAELAVGPLVDWLKTAKGMDVKRARIWQWAKRGHITRTNEKGQARYSPAAVLIHARKDTLERLDKAVKTS